MTETAEFRPALEAAFAHDGPTVIELVTDPETDLDPHDGHKVARWVGTTVALKIGEGSLNTLPGRPL